MSVPVLAPAPFTSPIGNDPVRVFRIYNHYRVVVSVILLAVVFVNPVGSRPDMHFAAVYQGLSVGYAAVNVFIALLLLAGIQPSRAQMAISIVLDLIALHVLLVAGSGIDGGAANLVVIAVAAGNILFRSRMGILFAALAAIASLSTAMIGVARFGEGGDNIVRAGLLGMLYFATAFFLSYVANRLDRSEQLAVQRAQSIAELEQLNHQIIQRMRTGIVVCDDYGKVRMANAAAGELLTGRKSDEATLSLVPQILRERLYQWVRDVDARTEPFRPVDGGPELQANFTRLRTDNGQQVLMFLDDTSKVAQQAQQLKLASLGRLTAGIAHEIRNPLAAISHASQLLQESESLDPADRQMTEIIQRHCVRVNGIVENVLQLSRRSQSDATLIDINVWLENFVEEYRQAHGTHVEITLQLYPHHPQGRFDPSQLEQILTNLFDNGLRYSAAHTGRSTLIIETNMIGDSARASIDVKDHGAGVAAEVADHLFEPFFTTDKKGTGLGLYLSRELCEANQAQLAWIPDYTEGSCFRVTFAPYRRMT